MSVSQMLRSRCACVSRATLSSRAAHSSVSVRYIQRDALKRAKESPLAFVFDIDGVLIQGSKVLPQAQRALKILDGANPFNVKIPYVLLTNGGGVSEEERCKRLTERLGVPIGPSQYVQAHTVLKSVVHKYADEPVLVLGGRNDVVRKVAEGYGFKHVYTTLDVKAWNSAIWPFHDLTEAELASVKPVDFSSTPIRAVLVFHDPRNWALDTQVTLDVIRSGGIIGGPYRPATAEPKVELIFCNPDLLWRNEFDRPRLGQGAFKEAFQAVYKAATGSTYPTIQFGKPTTATYKFAEEVLRNRIFEVQGQRIEKMPQIYMVGDNPASDIAGANGAGWRSVLVRTGVYDPTEGPPAHEPTFEAADVEEAVTLAIQRTGVETIAQ
ncbi:HAD-superfamily hydrolase [Trametopsis cervina]|nr:HAD-superfamily hydrolase [Trametopsis cervina]